MELQGERLIPAPVEATWAALNDPETLKACIAGCETFERAADGTFNAVVAMKVGPVSARFKGRMQMTNVRAPEGCTIEFDGQGGVAGFGKGSADVTLAPEAGADGAPSTRLKYAARATVGGKMAQVGARLIDAAAGKITDDFFAAFEARMRPAAPPPAEAQAEAAPAGAAAAPPGPAPAGGGGARIAPAWWWVAAAVVLVLLYVWWTR
jgi:carbon monoxide dehydrogenase subunit G